MKRLQFVPSRRGRDMLIIDGFIFHQNKEFEDGSIYWRCQKDKTKLKFNNQCRTLGDRIIVQPSQHNHGKNSDVSLKMLPMKDM